PESVRPRTDHSLQLATVLPANAELVDDRAVPLGILVLEIFEQAPSLADQHQQSPPRVMVLRVGLEVLGEAVDPLGDERDLDLGRTRVALVRLELLDQALLAVDGKRHGRLPPIATLQRSLPGTGSKN